MRLHIVKFNFIIYSFTPYRKNTSVSLKKNHLQKNIAIVKFLFRKGQAAYHDYAKYFLKVFFRAKFLKKIKKGFQGILAKE